MSPFTGDDWPRLTSPEKQQRDLQTHLAPPVSSYIFTFPQFDALGSLKPLSLVLPFAYKCLVLWEDALGVRVAGHPP